MGATTVSRSQRLGEAKVWQTLWDQCPATAPLLAIGIAFFAFVMAYLPNFHALVTIWNQDPNYTHGYLVIPISLYILWQQLSTPVPKITTSTVVAPWWGWVFLALTLILRIFMYERGSEWLENFTLILAVAALAWSFGSWHLLRRIWPAIAFLVFMLPLPRVLNDSLALQLQSFAATSSRFLLQLTGIWVIQEGNVINLSTAHGMERLDVALACNGLRMLMTMAATVTATIILLPLPNWKRIVLLLSIVPIALVSNMARIVATGWAYFLFEGDTVKHWAHDWAGWLMMPLALVLVVFELGILSWLVAKETSEDQPLIPLLNVSSKTSSKNLETKTRENYTERKKKKQAIDEV